MSAAGIAIAVGATTAANELFFAPASGSGAISFNWRIIPATAIFALFLNGLEKLSPTLADGIGYTALITALIVPLGKANSPIVNLDTILGAKTP